MSGHIEKDNVKYPPLRQIYFYLTGGCNLRCRHCWISPKYQGESSSYPYLDYDLFCSIIAQARRLGLNGVKLTGGEPFLHPEIHRIIEHIRKEDLRLNIETNGVLCTKGLAEEIKACKNPFISVSIDGADAETHEYVRGVAGCFDGAIQGIGTLVEAGLRPQVIMTVMRRNKDQLEAVVRLAERLGAGSVKFNIVQPTERGVTLHETGAALTIEELIEIGRWVEMALAKKTALRLHYSHPVAFRPLSRLIKGNACNNGMCGIFGIIGVLSDGAYALCGIGESVKELVFGRAEEVSLESVWRGSDVLRRIRAGLPEGLKGVCSACVMKKACLGNCVAQNYYRTKDLLSPYWFCEGAKKKGLFPESRLRG